MALKDIIAVFGRVWIPYVSFFTLMLMLEKITMVEIENVCFTLYSYNSGTTQKTIRKFTRH